MDIASSLHIFSAQKTQFVSQTEALGCFVKKPKDIEGDYTW